MQQDFAIECTPIDMQSKMDIDKMYNAIKAKLAVRQMMMQQNPELANHPFIQLQKGEPLDIEAAQQPVVVCRVLRLAEEARPGQQDEEVGGQRGRIYLMYIPRR